MKAESNINLISALTLHQRKRDNAIGLSHVTAKQRGLLWYCNILLERQAIPETARQVSDYLAIVQASGSPEEKRQAATEAAVILTRLEMLSNGRP